MQQEAENIETEIEIEEETTDSVEVELSDKHEQEVEEYSEKVQKRIDKLTYNQREAERQRDEAIRVAGALRNKVEEFEQKNSQTNQALFQEYNGRVVTELELEKDKYRKSITEGDIEAQLASQQNIAKLAVEQETLSRAQKQREAQAKNGKAQQQPPAVDPRATTWAKKKENSWFGRDEAMTAAAFAIDKKMQEEGTDPTAADYYELLDEKIQEAFPHKFEKESKSFPVQAVGRNSVGTNPNTRKTKKVKLTASQQAIAKKLGVPLEEYAKYV